MTPRHAAKPAHQRGRMRLLIVVLAPAVVLLPLSAWAVTSQPSTVNKTVSVKAAPKVAPAAKSAKKAATPKAVTGSGWAQSWSPALALLSNYVKNQPSKAGFLALPLSLHTKANQVATFTATFRTNWVDVKALVDGPNIAQQGLSVQPMQFKLQIMHGATPASHRGNCHIVGTTGHILAYGPSIDVADGKWHTITCIKYADTAKGTKVVVIVDGVAGKAKWSHKPLGNILPTGNIRLGGRGPIASTDSLDGWISAISFKLG